MTDIATELRSLTVAAPGCPNEVLTRAVNEAQPLLGRIKEVLGALPSGVRSDLAAKNYDVSGDGNYTQYDQYAIILEAARRLQQGTLQQVTASDFENSAASTALRLNRISSGAATCPTS